MKQLGGKISDRLREQLDPNDPAWTPPRPGEPASDPGSHPNRKDVKGYRMGRR